MKLKQSLCLILSVILISSPTMAQTMYVTESPNDPELNYLDVPYMVWPDAPYRGVLVPVDRFKTGVGLMSAAHDIEYSGIDALPDKPLPMQTDELVWGGAVGIAATLTLCFLLKCQF